MIDKIKYELLDKPLELYKAHDFCASGAPKLTVVMVHGIASEAKSFNGLLKYLEGTRSMQDVRFVAFDLLGAGQSYRSDKLDYDYKDQLEALHNSIGKLELNTPVVLVGHSMGTLIVTRYADKHKRGVKELVLISPPIYRPEDFENPLFVRGLEDFKKAVALKNRAFLKDKAFNNEMELIVGNRKNYEVLARASKPVTLIYGELDQIIAPFNIPGILKANPNITAIKTVGRHRVTPDKYSKVLKALEQTLSKIR